MTGAELAKRVERLERGNRRLKGGGLALLAMLVALTMVYATRSVPDVIIKRTSLKLWIQRAPRRWS